MHYYCGACGAQDDDCYPDDFHSRWKPFSNSELCDIAFACRMWLKRPDVDFPERFQRIADEAWGEHARRSENKHRSQTMHAIAIGAHEELCGSWDAAGVDTKFAFITAAHFMLKALEEQGLDVFAFPGRGWRTSGEGSRKDA